MSSSTPSKQTLLEETVIHPVKVIPPDPTPVKPAQMPKDTLGQIGPTIHVLDLTEPILDVLTSPSL